ncbi:hypothetical protein [Streptomyces sp. 35G-GA-8]|uniref:hypothetical protein n=1 Tax=Streptomyces sp. 35G-GA-8 TaxID=2939434 RepID=UPI00201E8C24|nr:hypothetical protein [Streptomyces sp. 35G-GA-8]MCL7380449.1 hypothetical protein [Streptomyces sp. 35G-GA-8]
MTGHDTAPAVTVVAQRDTTAATRRPSDVREGTAIAHALRDVLDRHTHAAEQITALVHIVDATLNLALARTREQQNNGLRRISALASVPSPRSLRCPSWSPACTA